MRLVFNEIPGVPVYEYKDTTGALLWRVGPNEETPEISDAYAEKLLKRTIQVLGGASMKLFRLPGTDQPNVRQPSIRERLAANRKDVLVEMLKELDLDYKGRKDVLVERLAEAYEAEQAAAADDAEPEENPGLPIEPDVEPDVESDGMGYSDLEDADAD